MDLTGHEAPTHPEKLGHRGPQLLHDYLSKERTQIHTKDTPVLETVYISEKDREILYNSNFSKVSVPRKGKTRTFKL
jgi:hypothetical protein